MTIDQERDAIFQMLLDAADALEPRGVGAIPANIRRGVKRLAALASHSPDDVEKVKAALVLAANRLDLLVVEAIAAGNPHSIEYGQWVEEARAALTARKAT